MDTTRVLLIIRDVNSAETVQRALSQYSSSFRIYSLADAGIAEARLDGGGIDVVVADLSNTCAPDEARRIEQIIAKRPIPSIVLCESQAEAGEGSRATVYLPRARWPELPAQVRSVMERHRPFLRHDAHAHAPNSRVAIIGAKGGAGVTTLAVNLAWIVGQTGETRLVELRSGFGTVRSYFRPQQLVGSLQSLTRLNPVDLTGAQVESAMWPCGNVPGLRILSPPADIDAREFTPAQVQALMSVLPRRCDHLIIDLPPFLSPVTQEVFRYCDSVILTMERDPLSVDAARSMLRAIAHQDWTPPSVAAVVINRNPVVCPMPLAEIEKQLEMPIAAMIPPDAELCFAAQASRTSVVALRPDSLLSQTLLDFASRFFGSAAPKVQPMRPAELVAK